MVYTDVHRLWLQTCATRGCIPSDEAFRMFSTIWQHEHKKKPSAGEFNETNTQINTRLQSMSQQISTVTCHVQNKSYVIFADTSNAAIMRTQTNITEPERLYFHLLLKEIVTSANAHDDDAADDSTQQPTTAAVYAIDQIAAINLTSEIRTPRQLAKQRAEQLLATWTRQGYFCEHRQRLHIGPRTIVEFGHHLMSAYPDHVPGCMLCKAVVFAAVRCDGCAQPFHKQCLRQYLARNSNCPKCKKLWSVRLSGVGAGTVVTDMEE